MPEQIAAPPFQERKFLLFLLSEYEKENGSEIRFLPTWQIGVHSSYIHKKFASLALPNGEANSPFIRQWFQEASARGIIEPRIKGSSMYVCFFTKDGYQKAIAAKHPVRHFLKNKWMWAVPISITIILAIAKILLA